MKNYRNTYVDVNLNNITNNVKKIIKEYPEYRYYFGVVKADSYGHYGIETVEAILEGGCNYLAVSSLEEALVIRKKIPDIPIICLGYISEKYVDECIKNNITITITSLEYMQNLIFETVIGLKVHVKLDTGMNRLGIKDEKELTEVVKILKEKNIILEGVFTHIYNAQDILATQEQMGTFEGLIERCGLQDVQIIHVVASESIVRYRKNKYINGCRLGIIMYGFSTNKKLDLKSTFSLCSEIIEIKKIAKGETVGYGGIYCAKEDEIIAIVPVGYADGVIRKNTGRNVYVNEKEYPIIGNICMDMLMIKIDDSVKLHDKVYILKDVKHIEKVAKHMDTIPYELLCQITKRVPREYTK